MKNLITAILGIVIVTVLILCVTTAKSSVEGYLRIHIRANSNSEADQNVKYKVKEEVSSFLTGVVGDCKDAQEAMGIVDSNLYKISSIASDVLKANGFSYGAKAKLTEEYFPTRSYDSLVLENGLYDALIIELGSGQGDNWWCVVYPPLCFKNNSTGNNNFKSIFKK